MFFFFKLNPAYDLRISAWCSDVCSSDLDRPGEPAFSPLGLFHVHPGGTERPERVAGGQGRCERVPQVVRATVMYGWVSKSSEERRVGEECVRKCRYRASP